MENTLKANPKDVAEQYEKQLSDLKEAYGGDMLEIRFLKKLRRHLVIPPFLTDRLNGGLGGHQ